MKREKLIFLIEPEREQNILMSKLLEESNYRVISSKTFDEAKKKFKENIDSVDFIIVDFFMPNGFELLKELETLKEAIPTLIVSGSIVCSSESGCEICSTIFNHKRMTKPIRYKTLVEAIENFDSFSCDMENRCDLVDKRENPLLF